MPQYALENFKRIMKVMTEPRNPAKNFVSMFNMDALLFGLDTMAFFIFFPASTRARIVATGLRCG